LLKRHGVSARSILLAAKSAQPAGGYANVGGIDVAIDVEVSLIAMPALANQVGHPADSEDIAGTVKRESVILREAFAAQYLLRHRVQPGVVCLKLVSHLLQ